MSEQKQAIWPLVLMLIFYGLMLVGSAVLLFFGLAFGSEAYRERGIPLEELLMMSGPFIVSLALLVATVFLWNAGKYLATYIMFGATFLMFFLGFFLSFGMIV
ncbi:MAG: hypothetical protein ABJ242_11895 [Marinomonas sp.]